MNRQQYLQSKANAIMANMRFKDLPTRDLIRQMELSNNRQHKPIKVRKISTVQRQIALNRKIR